MLVRRAEREPPTEAARPALLLELGSAASRAGHADGVELLRAAFELADGQPARARAPSSRSGSASRATGPAR